MENEPMPALTRHVLASTLIAALALAGCGKVGEAATEQATEKATEKMIESQITKEGGSAKVDLSQGGATVEGTDKEGKSYKMEMGSASLDEKELGLPFYPGAKPAENGGTRIRNGEIQMASLELDSSAPPQDVAKWYREQLKGRSGEGMTVIDTARDDKGMQLSIMDGKKNESISVEVAAGGENGSRITLIHSSGGK
jgi:hypothetical protein